MRSGTRRGCQSSSVDTYDGDLASNREDEVGRNSVDQGGIVCLR